jgi:hypothetical protein
MLSETYGDYVGMRLLRGPSRTNIVGCYSGWDAVVSPVIVNAFGQNGGSQTFGQPVPSLNPYSSNGLVIEWPWLTGCLVQTFNSGNLGDCAIVYDRWANLGQAFLMHGQIWQYYKAHDGPNMLLGGTRIGGPVDSEQYAIDNTTSHRLVVQEFANGYLVYDTVTGVHSARPIPAGGGDSDFTIAMTWGDSVNLIPTAWPMSDTQVYLSWNQIANAVSYRVYRNDQLVSNVSGLEYTDSGLLAKTGYQYYLEAINSSGQVLCRSDTLTIQTKDPPGTPTMDLTVQGKTYALEFSCSPVNGASVYQVFLNNILNQTLTVPFGTINNLYELSYVVQVKALDSLGNIIAQSSVKSVTLGQNVVITSRGPSSIGRNQSGTIVFTIQNLTDNPIYGFDPRIIQSTNGNWLVPNSMTYPDPGLIPAN